MAEAPDTYGLLARFASADNLLTAARALRADGVPGVEAYSPYPIEGLADEIESGSRGVALSALFGAIVAGVATYVMQWYSAVWGYPFVLGGKPLNSWPAFFPPTAAMVMLFAVIGAWIGMLVQNRMPQLYHPAFNCEAFTDASSDGFFLLVAHPANDDERDGELERRLHDLGAVSVEKVSP